ncbi:efflux RND transporter periplasmic adaptor subunit [Acinetobacter sp. NEB 394]|uniref:efflux RND transporter periplasmic adaptor subunit n=1 Tax=Acinetobacter sp. NEB 394 TaxID=2743575 RepID=UPI0015966454|nr:efflux RND transporter periplasmic adaptor subunit [Acinetobacter sp. NEB 394]QKY89223.1 efflux RND transporter periplasmic adaptor subunit [Acinetobacter sp. NEB 394]
MSKIQTLVASMMVVCSITLWGCSKDTTEPESVPLVMVSQPNTTHLEQKSYAGEVQARQQTALSFRVGGQVTERLVDVGDQVKVGQVLARLDVQDAQLQLNAAKAQLESAQAAEKNAQDELKRFKQLLPSHAVSRSQYDSVENQYKAALSSLKQAQANYNVTQNQTSYNQLIANKNGVITERNIEIGQVISAGQPAFQLAISGDREVVIGVPEQAIAQIKVGQDAIVTLWSKPDERFAAYVREISPAADQSRTFSVKVALREGQNTIQLGQSARVFFSSTESNVLSVPLASVSAAGKNAYVWVVNADNSIRKVPVSVGEYSRNSVTIRSGLQPKDYVVVGGVHLLREKQKIQPISRDNKTVKIATGS